MPTWPELKNFVKTKYQVADENEDSFKLVFGGQDKRLQAVIVSRFASMGLEWCDFSAACLPVEELEPRLALIKNFELAVGSVAIDNEVYVVRCDLPLEWLDLNQIELPIHVVLSTANSLIDEAEARALR